MASPGNVNLSPSLEDLQKFCHICRRIAETPKVQMIDLAAQLGISKRALHNLLDRLKESYHGVELIARKRNNPHKQITKEGRKLWTDAQLVLDLHARILSGERTDAFSVGVTNAVLVHLMPEPMHRFFGTRMAGETLGFVEANPRSLLAAVYSGAVEFAVGPYLKHSSFKGVQIERIADLEVFAACHPRHRWILEKREYVQPEDFAAERLLVLPDDEQPGLFDRFATDPVSGGKRVTMQNFTSVLASIRMGCGVSVIPTLPTKRKVTGVRSISMKRFGPVPLAVYLPSGGRRALRDDSFELLTCFEEWVEEQYK